MTTPHPLRPARPDDLDALHAIYNQAVLAAARAQGLHTMVAAIDADNTGSIALHRKLGFEETGVLRQVGYKFDRWLDLAFMTCNLVQNRPSAQ